MEKRSIACACMVVLAVATTTASANPYGIKLNPGERLIAVDGVPVNSSQASTPVASTQPSTPSSPGVAVRTMKVATHATNIVGNLVRSSLPFSHSDGATALEKANTERAKQGYGALMPDPALQELALRKATIAAQRGYKNHIGGSLGGAACEGVGHTNGRFLTCCLDERGTYGGAAMVQGRDGWYCCLLVR